MAQYCRAEGVNPDDGLVLMVVANKITPRFFQAIVARGGVLQQCENGLWSGHLSLIPLHVVETSVRAEFETERLLYTLSAQVIVNPHIVGQMSNQETQVLQLLYRYFKRLHQQGRLDMALNKRCWGSPMRCFERSRLTIFPRFQSKHRKQLLLV